MKPRKRSLPGGFLKEWRITPPSQWMLRPAFERFYNAGLDESREVLRELYEVAADRMSFPPELFERIKDALGDEKLTQMTKPSFCAICTRARDDLLAEKEDDRILWTCTDCRQLSAGNARYSFDESPPDATKPLGAKGRGDG